MELVSWRTRSGDVALHIHREDLVMLSQVSFVVNQDFLIGMSRMGVFHCVLHSTAAAGVPFNRMLRCLHSANVGVRIISVLHFHMGGRGWIKRGRHIVLELGDS